MSDYAEIKNEIVTLIETGKQLGKSLIANEEYVCSDLPFFLKNYEIWYTKAMLVVKQIIPDRTQDFLLLYSNPKRKTLEVDTYCIDDALRGIQAVNHRYGPWVARICVLRQLKMLETCIEKFDSKIFDMQTILQADVFDSEIETAKHLLKMGFLRASGAICGVILEKHFKDVCKRRNISIHKKSPTIADYNDALKDHAYDTLEWRKIQRLGDIRNLCDHSKEREPTKEEVEELISGTERIIKTVF